MILVMIKFTNNVDVGEAVHDESPHLSLHSLPGSPEL